MSGPSRIPHVPRPSRVSGSLAAHLGPPVIERSAVGEVLHRYGLDPACRPLNLRLGRRSRNVAVRTVAGRKRGRPGWPCDVVAIPDLPSNATVLDLGAADLVVAYDFRRYAADTARFDASDLMPSAVGAGSFWTGMVEYMAQGPDAVQGVLDEIEASWPAE